MAEEKKSSIGKWIIIILVILILGFISIILAAVVSVFFSIGGETSASLSSSGNVAVIPINGVILTETSTSPFSGDADTSSTDVVEYIERANENPSIKAIVFEINSPGGSGVASDEIAQAIKLADKPTIAYIREVGASGAYWVASATDRVYANRMSIVGSIGVIGSYLEFSGLLERYNVTYQRFVAGKYKDFGSPFRKPSKEEKDLFQVQLDAMHDIFIEQVAINRNMSKEQVEDLATGFIFTGDQALANGLIDEIGGKREVVAYLEQELNMSITLVEYKKKRTLLDLLGEVSAQKGFSIGRGIGASLIEESKKPQMMTVVT